MSVRIDGEPIDHLDEHATISVAFVVERILEDVQTAEQRMTMGFRACGAGPAGPYHPA
jgi:hypothetical protein